MACNTELGRGGEQLAVDWLTGKGYTILHRNWRYRQFEIDIVALKNEMPHFVEVKYRSSQQYGYPEAGVQGKKKSAIFRAVNEFMFRHPAYRDFRVDILSIYEKKKGDAEYFFIEDVYL
ncbi:MAG: YraN family protein [Flavisolibacter sp.]|jgi:putative endonuclease